MKIKKRCQINGCINYKYKNDERCLIHIRQKYASYWNKTTCNDPVTGRRNISQRLDQNASSGVNCYGERYMKDNNFEYSEEV